MPARPVLGAAVKAGAALSAYTSVLGSSGVPADHHATEDAIRASGIPYSLLRNNLYHEMVTMNIPAALEHGALVRAAGEGRLASASYNQHPTQGDGVPCRCQHADGGAGRP